MRPADPADDEGRITLLLAAGPRTAAQLTAAMRISQPTLSRIVGRMNDSVAMFRVPGERTPRYGLLRQLPLGLPARQRIYRVLSNGSFAPFAEVSFLAGGATLERLASGEIAYYEGLPPYMTFASPSGFLGRQLAQQAAQDLRFPSSLKDWGDEHRVAYLFTRGLNLPGNLIFGDTSFQAEMDLRQVAPTPAARKAEHFLQVATELKDAAQGSSAGGEQPKFLDLTEDAGHVIVKFAKLGSRMAQLLPLEHLALRALSKVGVPAAATQLLSAGDYVFLEVQRFDRAGRSGRVGMLSAGAVDDEFFGLRDTWSQFAARCVTAKYLTPLDARRVDTMAAFSELIGNTDRHFENISLLIDERGEYQGIAPAYDILPMRYASIGGGVDPDLTPVEPRVGTIGVQPEVWACAMEAAERFWSAVQDERLALPIDAQMKDLAARNLAVDRRFVEPLLPSGTATG
jgi:hypothetical protein